MKLLRIQIGFILMLPMMIIAGGMIMLFILALGAAIIKAGLPYMIIVAAFIMFIIGAKLGDFDLPV